MVTAWIWAACLVDKKNLFSVSNSWLCRDPPTCKCLWVCACLISSSTQSDAEKKIEGKRSRREMPSQTKVDQWYLVMSVSYVSEHLINKNLYYAWVKKI